jgi:hypothetical protein
MSQAREFVVPASIAMKQSGIWIGSSEVWRNCVLGSLGVRAGIFTLFLLIGNSP